MAVRGILECNGRPAANVKVKLYEKELRKYPSYYTSLEDKIRAIAEYSHRRGSRKE